MDVEIDYIKQKEQYGFHKMHKVFVFVVFNVQKINSPKLAADCTQAINIKTVTVTKNKLNVEEIRK